MVVAVAVLVALTLLWRGCARDAADPASSDKPEDERPPTPVRVIKAAPQQLAVQIKALGTVAPLRTVTVRPRVDGQLLRVTFQEGQQVTAGQLLAEIDPAPFRIQLAQANGQQKQNLAELENVRIQLKRFRNLANDGYVSAQDVANLEAQVRQFEGRLEIDQAAVDDAKLQLSYTRIVAPVSGRVGLRSVDAGNLVTSADSAGITTIAQTRPISVLFSVPESALAAVTEAVARDAKLPVQAWDREERAILATGELSSVDNSIDPKTGTLRMRALFDNRNGALFPNLFVNMRMQLEATEQLAIPDAAVQYGSKGTYVYVIRPNGSAQARPVVLGAASDGQIAVTDGLRVGEQVVLEGIDGLSEGGKVKIVTTPEAGSSNPRASPGQ